MNLFLEISQPFCWKHGQFESSFIRRFWWGWFAFGWWKVPFDHLEALDKPNPRWVEKTPTYPSVLKSKR